MDNDIGKLDKLERFLRIPEPGSLPRYFWLLYIIIGLIILLPSIYLVLFFSQSFYGAYSASSLMGVALILLGVGDRVNLGGLGTIIRISWFSLFLVAGIIATVSTYRVAGSWGLVLVAAFVIIVSGVVWLLKKMGAGA